MEQLRVLGLKRNKMVEEKKDKKVKTEEKFVEKEAKKEERVETKKEEVEAKKGKKENDKKDGKKDKKAKKVEPKRPKKDEAVAIGRNLRVSKKNAGYVCRFIKGKDIDKAIFDLGEVIKMRKAVPFKGEIPHRKGMMSGRYPVKAAGEFIKLLKGLKGNVIVNGMDLDKTRISIASASWSSRPMRSGGRKSKRTNVLLKAREAKK